MTRMSSPLSHTLSDCFFSHSFRSSSKLFNFSVILLFCLVVTEQFDVLERVLTLALSLLHNAVVVAVAAVVVLAGDERGVSMPVSCAHVLILKVLISLPVPTLVPWRLFNWSIYFILLEGGTLPIAQGQRTVLKEIISKKTFLDLKLSSIVVKAIKEESTFRPVAITCIANFFKIYFNEINSRPLCNSFACVLEIPRLTPQYLARHWDKSSAITYIDKHELFDGGYSGGSDL